MGPRCSSAETQVCHRSNIIAATKPSEANVKNNFRSHIDKKIFLTFLLTSLSLYIFTIWKCIVYHRLCRDKIMVSEYKLFKRSNKTNLFNWAIWIWIVNLALLIYREGLHEDSWNNLASIFYWSFHFICSWYWITAGTKLWGYI